MNSQVQDLIFFEPIFHEKLWGGSQMRDHFGYDIPSDQTGECWAISAHPHGDCVVAQGVWKGHTLSQLWREHRELFGGLPGEEFPLLVKIIDARDHLSVQVHPDDAYAFEHEQGSLGKRECWYVLAAQEQGTIIAGQHARSREEFERSVAEGRLMEVLNVLPCHAGDFLRIDPGCVHAIQAGTLILEIQQSSDVTYRVYDYDRLQDDGTPRELHLEQSYAVIDYEQEPLKSPSLLPATRTGIEELMRCEQFVVERVRCMDTLTLRQTHPFMCMSVVSGEGKVTTDAGTTWTLQAGMHALAPCQSGDVHLTGDFELMVAWVPQVSE